MFTSNEWTKNKLSKEAKGRGSFKGCSYAFTLEPCGFNFGSHGFSYSCIWLVDRERKATMGYMYEAM